jgi:hypothetical protein
MKLAFKLIPTVDATPISPPFVCVLCWAPVLQYAKQTSREDWDESKRAVFFS